MPRLRTLLVLAAPRICRLFGRIVWRVGGWAAMAMSRNLPLLFVGVTLLYIGGMYLNDAFDVNFDRQHRKERPIPSRRHLAGTVWKLALLWILLGLTCLCFGLATRPDCWASCWLSCILVYDARSQVITFSPLLMGACRFLFISLAASDWCGARRDGRFGADWRWRFMSWG